MKSISAKLVIGILLLLNPMASMAQAEVCKVLTTNVGASAIDAAQKAYEAIASLEATFSQDAYMLGLDETRTSSGVMYFSKPGKMDWRYREPVEQRFVSDGETVWFYQPDLNQVTVGVFKQAFTSDLPVSFLLGLSTLKESFRLDTACEKEGMILLTLAPQSADASVKSFILGVDKTSFLPKKATVVDVGGNENTILFSKIEANSSIPGDAFSFSIPKGVDVVDQREGAGGGS